MLLASHRKCLTESEPPHVPAAHRRCPANPNCALLPTSEGCYLDPMFDLPDLAGTARLKWGGVENLLSIRSTIRSTMSPQRDACPMHAYLPDTHPMHMPVVCAVRGGRLEAPHETALYARFACARCCFRIISPTRLRRVLTSAFGPPSPPIPASGRVRAYPEVKDGLDCTTIQRNNLAWFKGHDFPARAIGNWAERPS